jgi:hypothetical protein
MNDDEVWKSIVSRSRGLIGSIVFCALLLIGFLVTPGFVRVLNTEYWLAVHDQQPRIDKLTKTIQDKELEIGDAERDISTKTSILSDLNALLQREISSSNMEDKPSVPGFGPKSRRISSEIDSVTVRIKELKDQLARLQAEKKLSENYRSDLQAVIDRAAGESTNLYLVARALALGAIGALMSILAKSSMPIRRDSGTHDLAKMWSSMAIGAVVSVVALGLFHTRQISIFHTEGAPTGTPDFWRVTILCLIAGAFADRIFQAAAGKVDIYLGEQAKPRVERKTKNQDDSKVAVSKPALVAEAPRSA